MKNESLFRCVCVIFSVLLLGASLFARIRLSQTLDERSALLREVAALEEENEILRVRAETSFSLERIERYAREVLGMQPCTPAQIVPAALHD